VSLGPGVRITSVAAGGRHTLALSGKWNLITCWVVNYRLSESLVSHRCFCGAKIFLEKYNFFILKYFYIFINYFEILISKLNFKK
jgi:hypothetical protein